MSAAAWDEGAARIEGDATAAALSSAATAYPDTAANVKLLAQWMQQGLGAGKKVFDATYYSGKGDLRPWGFEPLYLADDGDFNRTVWPEQRLSFPDPTKLAAVEKAYRKIARVATGVEDDIFNHRLKHPAYNRVNQLVSIDVETAEFEALDAMAEPTKRREIIQNMSRMLDAMKDEQAKTGVESKGVGIFLWPPAYWSGKHTAQMPAALAQAKQDFKPLVDRVDVFFPEVYIHDDDTAKWLTSLRGNVAACRAADPTKPVYVYLCPQYAHNATPARMGQPVSPATWRFAVEATLREADGLVVWGGGDHRPGFDPQVALPWGAPLAAPDPSARPPAPASIGDVDRDGAVNASDLVLTRNRIGRVVNPLEGVFADVDGSGLITASDLVIVRNKIGEADSPLV